MLERIVGTAGSIDRRVSPARLLWGTRPGSLLRRAWPRRAAPRHMAVTRGWSSPRMYQERYDPVLHPDEAPECSSTLNRILMLCAVVSGSLCLYAIATAIG